MDSLETNLNNYFNMSLKSLRLFDFENAIDLIDLAIIHSTKKDFYMFQKVKILFIACLYPKCSCYIKENLTYFYEHCSLKIFTQILYYYQQSCGGATDPLDQLLAQKGIPPILTHKYITNHNKNDVAFLKKATDAMEKNDYATCINFCNLLLKQNVPSISIYLMKGKSHQMLGQYDLSIKTYKNALLLQPDSAPIYHNLGVIMIALKQYAKAISYSQRALRIEPANVVYRNLLAESFYKWRKYDSALIHFKKVIIQNPNCTEAYLRIADIYNLIQKPRKAKRYYKKTLRLQLPNNC